MLDSALSSMTVHRRPSASEDSAVFGAMAPPPGPDLNFSLTPQSVSETAPTVATCTASQPGKFEISVGGGDPTISTFQGSVAFPPFQFQQVITWQQTGKNRGPSVSCTFFAASGGQTTLHAGADVTDSLAPLVNVFSMMGPPQIGQPFDIEIDVEEPDLQGFDGNDSRIDHVLVQSKGPLLVHTPVFDAAGALQLVETSSAECIDVGPASLWLRAFDMEGNTVTSQGFMFECFP
ncbi:MAG: hypothetical protein AAGF11_07805 [Myxococcota bacterium]